MNRAALAAALVCCVLAAPGCGKYGPPQRVLRPEQVEPVEHDAAGAEDASDESREEERQSR